MKRTICVLLCLLLTLTACGTPAAEVTPTPEPTPTTEVISTPEPTPIPTEIQPEETPFPSYEDFFAQVIDYGSMFDEEEHEYGHHERVAEDDPVIAWVKEQIPEDTLGLIPKTMNWVIDRCFYVFWAGNEEGAYLYRLYSPTETLDLIYTIPKEEFEEKYFYTPQTEATAYFFRSSEYPDGAIGQKICLLREVDPRSNQLYEWSCYNPEFLAKFDEMAAHREDYPQYNWDWSYDELVPLIESNNWERWEEPFLYIGRCINAATGEYREREIDTYSPDRYEIQW